jgi:hypothetical protein
VGKRWSARSGLQEERIMIKRTVVALALGALGLANTAAAQETATVTLKSGEQMSAQLIDLNASGLATKVNGQDRMIALNDVAVIDFTGGGGTQADWDKLAGGQFVVLKDGQQLTGQLTDIGGATPLRLSFSISGNNRDLSSSDVARIVFARPNNAVATTGSTPSATTAPAGSLMVPGQQPWTPTGQSVRRGERLTFNATGQITFPGTASPQGSSETNPGNPIPSAPTGALIGKIGENGQPFVIGASTTVTAPAAGQLFVGINDGHFGDNSGSFQVQIQRAGRR